MGVIFPSLRFISDHQYEEVFVEMDEGDLWLCYGWEARVVRKTVEWMLVIRWYGEWSSFLYMWVQRVMMDVGASLWRMKLSETIFSCPIPYIQTDLDRDMRIICRRRFCDVSASSKSRIPHLMIGVCCYTSITPTAHATNLVSR